MLVNLHLHVEGLLDSRDVALHVQNHPIGMPHRHLKPVRLRMSRHLIVIALGWTKLLGKFCRCQILTVIQAGRIRLLAQQLRKRRLIAQRQADRQVQTLSGLKTLRGRQIPHHRGYMPLDLLDRPRPGGI